MGCFATWQNSELFSSIILTWVDNVLAAVLIHGLDDMDRPLWVELLPDDSELWSV